MNCVAFSNKALEKVSPIIKRSPGVFKCLIRLSKISGLRLASHSAGFILGLNCPRHKVLWFSVVTEEVGCCCVLGGATNADGARLMLSVLDKDTGRDCCLEEAKASLFLISLDLGLSVFSF